ncbi:Piso0_001054 [Millerozyma farinosa CBS 7064]|uniref:Piso0_001054 protein n=1 Tax=Pichia sorbitophila (strain ATCC MYA-4447 / BCRC 22081 / CBS 7064 / NBRC 10061 / NRRL Y-12695) TaxID=559304 RepID=G8YQT2_PICSO|nr:Piso0_001054 [Millerozyma farinosa CBS 7064]CCE79017.1 Piso0_001054 [Millerozyma farinosa CBS 7064]
MGGKEKLAEGRHQDPKINHDTITYMTKPNTFVIAKDKNQLNKTRATKQNLKQPTNAKKELSYGDIMRMCQKGKDPIDLLF